MKNQNRLSLKPNHASEDHDHLLLDGKELARVEYGDIASGEVTLYATNRKAEHLIRTLVRVSQPEKA